MPDVHTQTWLTGSRIEDFAKEIRRLKKAKRQRKWWQKKQASNRMVERSIVKDTLQKQKKSPRAPKRARSA